MYDIHCHIISGVDDGSADFDESCKMLEIAARSGTKGIVATPHTNVPDSYQNPWSKELYNNVLKLRTYAKNNELNLSVFCGQEIFCTEGVVKHIKSGKYITLNNSRYPLIEFKFDSSPSYVVKQASEIISEGYTPVIAHPERYYFVSDDLDTIRKMKKMGCVFQLNKGSLIGKFGNEVYETAQKLLEKEYADIVASDCHGSELRTPDLSEVYEQICEECSFDYADILFEINPSRVLGNRDIIKF